MKSQDWHAVDGYGLDPVTGRLPRPPGARSPASAVAAIPVAVWPLAVVAGDGRRVKLAGALGAGGAKVEDLLSRLVSSPPPMTDAEMRVLAASTPAGGLDLPLEKVSLEEAVVRAAEVDAGWLESVDRRRSSPRQALIRAGRELELEAALNIAMLLATERLDPPDDSDVDAHVASGAQLWLLGGAVTWALSGVEPDPFGPWADLVVAGLWPVGPSRGRLVVCPDGRTTAAETTTSTPTNVTTAL